MMEFVAVVHHAQRRKLFYHHVRTNRRDIGVVALRRTVPDRVQGPICPYAYCVLGIIFCLIPAIHISRKGALRLRTGESTKARGASVEDNNTLLLHSTILLDNVMRISQGLAKDTLQYDVLFRAVISATCSSSHVNVRRDTFVSSLI